MTEDQTTKRLLAGLGRVDLDKVQQKLNDKKNEMELGFRILEEAEADGRLSEYESDFYHNMLTRYTKKQEFTEKQQNFFDEIVAKHE